MTVIMTGNGPRHTNEGKSGARQTDFTQVPVIDFAAMLNDRKSDKAQVAASIRKACVEVGFFYLVNHGVPNTLLDRAFAAARRFFDQSHAAKSDIHISKSSHVRGYTPILEENFDTANGKGDLKESFDMALEVPIDHLAVQSGQTLYGPNVWPAGDSAFRTDVLAYYTAMLDLSRRLLQAFALALDLSPGHFESMIQLPLASMRLLHYPPQPGAAAEGQIGAGAHSDYECFTILAQDDVGGLQVLDKSGRWIAAPPVDGAFVVNIADMMARWTNDIFVSTLHRVVNASGRERYSIPFFFGPSYDAIIAPLPGCVSEDRPKAYPPVTAGQYLEERFAATYNHLNASP